MCTVRELMSADARCISAEATLVAAAKQMRALGVGALPICGSGHQYEGMLTDRDIVTRCLAAGKDPATMVTLALGRDKPVCVQADGSAEETLRIMARHRLRRLPVIDGVRLVGVVRQADVVRILPPDIVGQVFAELSGMDLCWRGGVDCDGISAQEGIFARAAHSHTGS